ncbi:MAG: thioesterase domain-containing protein, partial [Dehalococcoidia bacterium]
RPEPIDNAHEARVVEDGLTAGEAETALAHLLLSNATGHVLVVEGDFSSRWERFVRHPLRRAPDAAGRPSPPATGTPDWTALVLDAWRNCLEDPELGPDDDLFEHGADSLNSIEALTDISGRLGVTLPTDLIFEAQTPRLQATRIARLLQTPAGQSPGQESVRSWGAGQAAVWCLHPISGNADCFAPLADRLDGCQIKAVAGRPLAEVDEDEGIADQASRYRSLLAERDEPPALLAGWSYGGILAFETAQLVARTTGRAPVVALLDIPAPTRGPRSIDDVGDAEIVAAICSHRARETGRVLDVDMSRLRHADDGEALEHLLGRLRGEEVVPASFTVELARRLAKGYRRRMRALERYRPAPYPGRLILLRAREQEFGTSGLLDGVLPAPEGDATWGWGGLVSCGDCAVHVLDGHHATLLQPPSVELVANVLRQAIRDQEA